MPTENNEEAMLAALHKSSHLRLIVDRAASAIRPESVGDLDSLPYVRAVLQMARVTGNGRFDILFRVKDQAAFEADFQRLTGRPFDLSRDSITWDEVDALPVHSPRVRENGPSSN